MAPKGKATKKSTPKKAPAGKGKIQRSKPAVDEPVPSGSPEKGVNASPDDAEAVRAGPASPSAGLKRSAEPPQTPKKRAKIDDTGEPLSPRYPSPPHEKATPKDKRMWQGWCEIESEPSFFNVMIKEMEVKGVKMQEVLGLDPEALSWLPKPIHGLILLFRYRAVGTSNEDKKCPDGVWFANQMPSQNSCATLAIMNILMNTQNVDLGEPLRCFKEYTQPMTPFERGKELADFTFVKRIHNSFAKKMDMLEADLHLKRKFEANKPKKRRTSQDSSSSDESADNSNEPGHFIAYVPVNGHVWKMDGFDYIPQKVGEYNDDDDATKSWLTVASEGINKFIAKGFAEDIQYTLLAVVKCPLESLREDLCVNIASLDAVEHRLDEVDKDWASFAVADNEQDASTSTPLRTASEEMAITTEQLAAATVPEKLSEELKAAKEMPDLMAKRDELLAKNLELQGSIRMELRAAKDDQEAAENKRFDYTPAITYMLRCLAEKGALESFLS